MQTSTIIIRNEVGLHARPAALFVKEAGRHQARINVRNVTTDSDWVNAKSILRVLTLGVEKDHTIELEAEGVDEAQAIKNLEELVQADFHEREGK